MAWYRVGEIGRGREGYGGSVGKRLRGADVRGLQMNEGSLGYPKMYTSNCCREHLERVSVKQGLRKLRASSVTFQGTGGRGPLAARNGAPCPVESPRGTWQGHRLGRSLQAPRPPHHSPLPSMGFELRVRPRLPPQETDKGKRGVRNSVTLISAFLVRPPPLLKKCRLTTSIRVPPGREGAASPPVERKPGPGVPPAPPSPSGWPHPLPPLPPAAGPLRPTGQGRGLS